MFLYPESLSLRFCRLRTKRPAPNNNRKLRATCAVTRTLRSRTAPPAPATEPAASFSVLQRSKRVERNAGARPKISPVSNDSPMLNSRIRQFGLALSISTALPVGSRLNRPFVDPYREQNPQRAARRGENKTLDK